MAVVTFSLFPPRTLSLRCWRTRTAISNAPPTPLSPPAAVAATTPSAVATTTPSAIAAPTPSAVASLLHKTPANFVLVPPSPPFSTVTDAMERSGLLPPAAGLAVPYPLSAITRRTPWLRTTLPPLNVTTDGTDDGVDVLAFAMLAAGASDELASAVRAAGVAAASAHAAAVGVERAGIELRLAVVTEVPCPRWHADRVTLRGLVTLWGGGTLWVDESLGQAGAAQANSACCDGDDQCDESTSDDSPASLAAGWGMDPAVHAAVVKHRVGGEAADEQAFMKAAGGVVRQAPPGSVLFLKGGLWGAGRGAIHRSPDLSEGAGGAGRLVLQTNQM